MNEDVRHAASLSMEVSAVTSGIFASFRSMATGTSKPQINAPALAFLRQTSSHAPFESVARLVPEKSTNVPSSITSRGCKSSVRWNGAMTAHITFYNTPWTLSLAAGLGRRFPAFWA